MSSVPVNSTEEFVLGVCRRTFLSLWCDSNPRGKDLGDELCDILIVCDPHVVIVSVKEVKMSGKKDPAIEHERWKRKAIEESAKQIYGAERYIARLTQVTRQDGTPGLVLPSLATRKVHRIAVAFGSNGEVSIGSGDLGKGHVHVMTEDGFLDILSELDTITDLTHYLTAVEESSAAGCKKIILGSEADLLAYYLWNNCSFPKEVDLMLVDDTHWAALRERPEYKRKKEAEADSYYWDKLIEMYTGPNGELLNETPEQFKGMELALRTMARESRFNRRLLGKRLVEFFNLAGAGKTRSRSGQSPSGMLYVFLYFKPGEGLEARRNGLGNRCMIARHSFGKGDAVIGIGFHLSDEGWFNPGELVYLDTSDWTAEDDAEMEATKEKGNYEKAVTRHQVTEEEYPKG